MNFDKPHTLPGEFYDPKNGLSRSPPNFVDCEFRQIAKMICQFENSFSILLYLYKLKI